jgi:hypothetical protein
LYSDQDRMSKKIEYPLFLIHCFLFLFTTFLTNEKYEYVEYSELLH